ncbi:MAG: hypothetical protein IT564_08780 [Rhodospirillales bacterium]|nr:hypothetical protein [Rhodospirillales bacterium]
MKTAIRDMNSGRSIETLVRAAALGVALAGWGGLAFAQGPGGGYGYGPGMMGPGMGMMGPGMMGQGWGQGGGWGPGMGGGPGYGPGGGMMGQGGPGWGMMGPGAGMMPWGPSGEGRALSVDDAKAMIERRLAVWGNPRLKVGAVKEEGKETIVADVVTVDNSLVQRYQIDRSTGAMRPVRP